MLPSKLLLPVILLTITLLTGTCVAQTAAPKRTFESALHDAAFALQVDPATSAFSGTGAAVLQGAIDSANFVFLGESHVTREIPAFTAAVCHTMAPHGLTGYATEASVQAARLTQSLIGSPDRMARMREHLDRYPTSIAFLDIREENNLAANCSAAARNPHFRVWGVDQEFIGAGLWVLDEVLATKPGPHAAAALQAMRDKVAAAEKAATTQESDASKQVIESISDDEIANAATLLEREGSAPARAMFADLAESHSIYNKNFKGLPEANAQRARLLKRNLLTALDGAAAANPGAPPRFLIKLGGYHGYKGFNPLHQRDLGNMVAELADMRGQRSLHILVLGVRGTERGYAGFGKPTRLRPYTLISDADDEWLRPFVNAQVAGGSTLYDLRTLRFGRARPTQVDQQQLIDGYDLLVLIPEITPADMIEELPRK